jgi:hypothetical protein
MAAAPGGGLLPQVPPATTADVQAAVAAMQASFAAAIAPLQASIAAMQAAIVPMQAAILALNPGTMASTATHIGDARRFNCGRRLRFRIVPRNDGASPAHWPPGLSYARVQAMAAHALINLLQQYGVAHAGSVAVKRERLLIHIGYYA